MKAGSEDYVDDIQTVSDDRIAGGSIRVQRIFYEIPHIIGERFVQSEVNEQMRDPEVMIWGQSIVIPGNLHLKPKCHINHEECRPKVRINPGVCIAESCVWSVRLPDVVHKTRTSVSWDALLNLDMSEGLRAEIGYLVV